MSNEIFFLYIENNILVSADKKYIIEDSIKSDKLINIIKSNSKGYILSEVLKFAMCEASDEPILSSTSYMQNIEFDKSNILNTLYIVYSKKLKQTQTKKIIYNTHRKTTRKGLKATPTN